MLSANLVAYPAGLAMGVLDRLGLRRPGPPPCSASGQFEIAGVTVVNPMHGRRASATIEISGGSITGISDAQTPLPSGFAGCFALPGLVDMHVHLPPDNALKLTQGAALLYLRHGVTSVRDAGDLDGTAVAAGRRSSREGVYPVPRVISCGPVVGAGGRAVSDLRPGGLAEFADGPAGDRRVVSAVAESGFIPAGSQLVVRESRGSYVIVRAVSSSAVPTETAADRAAPGAARHA